MLRGEASAAGKNFKCFWWLAQNGNLKSFYYIMIKKRNKKAIRNTVQIGVSNCLNTMSKDHFDDKRQYMFSLYNTKYIKQQDLD